MQSLAFIRDNFRLYGISEPVRSERSHVLKGYSKFKILVLLLRFFRFFFFLFLSFACFIALPGIINTTQLFKMMRKSHLDLRDVRKIDAMGVHCTWKFVNFVPLTGFIGGNRELEQLVIFCKSTCNIEL